jgi:outer membrane protein assembly factor BamB
MSDPASHVTPASAVTGVTTTTPAPLASPPEPQVAIGPPRLRLWPAVIILALELVAITVPGWVVPGTMFQMFSLFLAPLVAAVGLAVWWLLASRAPRIDRLLVLVVGIAGVVAIQFFAHPVFLQRQVGLALIALPLATSAWVLWLLVTPMLPWAVRRTGLLTLLLLVWGYCLCLRIDGVYGSFDSMDRSWRWSPTDEEQLLAERAGRSEHSPAADKGETIEVQPADWPAFRGANRNANRPGIRIATDWDNKPPRQLWKQRVGPGWSSFSVVGDRLYTQEQRGKAEAVACYKASTGEELWVHQDDGRFEEAVSGAGPRATPTIHASKVYALGARGRLNCLDWATGKVIWHRDIAEDAGAGTPTWGFSSSPLVVEGLVLVFAGSEDKAVLAYDAASGGKPKWMKGKAGHSYSSPQLMNLAGAPQVLMMTDKYLMGMEPATGKELWKHEWESQRGLPRCIQPARVSDTDVLIGTGFGGGTRRVRIKRDGDRWTTEEVWTTRAINPYYNDFVIHKDHLYGFDGLFFTCVSLADGTSKWRVRGGYGNGQVVLLPDQSLLVVLSEKGEAALLEASPAGHKRLGKFQALEGKTWNHPVVAHHKLFVRNGKEMACYQLGEDEPPTGLAE